MWGAIIGGSLAMVSSIVDQREQNKAWAEQETVRRKQLLQAVRQANMQDASLQLQDKSNFEAARLELENQTLSHIKASSTVQTAMAESNLEGRSMNRTKADVDNAYLRTKGMINENYTRNYHNIYVERVSNRENLIATVQGSSAQYKPSQLSQALGVVSSAAQGANVGNSTWNSLKQVK